jgi:hypothetical protein
MRARASILRSVLLTGAAVLTLLAGTGVASAHGDEGELTVTKLEQVGPTTIAVEAGIVYEGDGHLAEDAEVTATLSGPGGATVGPVQLVRTGESTSLYAATVEVPAAGDWSVEVTSTEPAAEATQSISVTEQAAPVSSTTTPTDDAGDAAGEDTSTTAADELDAAPVTATAADDEESSPNLTLVVGASLVLFAIVMVGAVLVARQRAAKDAADDA